MNSTKLEAALGYVFRDPNLLNLALTHSSWANEHGEGDTHNERLEFLGDAVLELCVSQELFAKFPHVREGILTQMRSKLVSESSLAQIAREIGLETLLKLGRGEDLQKGRYRASVLSDALEAVLGAIFVDGGLGAAQRAVMNVFYRHWPCSTDDVLHPKDAKSELQEAMQQRFQARPVYAQLASSGPDHARNFEVSVRLPDGTLFLGKGASRKKAEQHAARIALDCLKNHR